MYEERGIQVLFNCPPFLCENRCSWQKDCICSFCKNVFYHFYLNNVQSPLMTSVPWWLTYVFLHSTKCPFHEKQQNTSIDDYYMTEDIITICLVSMTHFDNAGLQPQFLSILQMVASRKFCTFFFVKSVW